MPDQSVKSELEQLRVLVDLRDRALQKNRIAFGNRLGAIERGDDQAEPETVVMLQGWFETLQELEKKADRDIAKLAADVPIICEAVNVKGCGFVNVSKIVALIDITRSETVSQLWRYAGYAVIDGKAERLKKGEKAHFNRRLKTACWLLSVAFLRAKSPYRDEYDGARDYYEQERYKEWTDGHKHNAALRKVVKLWLSHLWAAWRELEGLPTRELYVVEKLGHTTIKDRRDYGWP